MRRDIREFIREMITDPLALISGIAGLVLFFAATLSSSRTAGLAEFVGSLFALELASFRVWRGVYKQTRPCVAERVDRVQAIVGELPPDALGFLKMLCDVRFSQTPHRAAGVWGLESKGIVTRERGTGFYRLADGYERIVPGLLEHARAHQKSA